MINYAYKINVSIMQHHNSVSYSIFINYYTWQRVIIFGALVSCHTLLHHAVETWEELTFITVLMSWCDSKQSKYCNVFWTYDLYKFPGCVSSLFVHAAAENMEGFLKTGKLSNASKKELGGPSSTAGKNRGALMPWVEK